MSTPKNQLTGRTKKKMNKEVRASASLPNPTIAGAAAKVKTLPKKVVKKTRPRASKRTTPGSIEGQPAAPFICHVEGERWLKTINKQIQAKKTVQKKRALKKGRS